MYTGNSGSHDEGKRLMRTIRWSPRILSAATACLVALALTNPASADLFFDEDFPTDGQLTTVSSDWFAFSGVGANPIQVVNSAAIVQGRSIGSGEDVSRITGSTLGAGETWYYGARITVEDINSNNSWTPQWFAGFRADNDGFVIPYTGRMYISPSTDETKYSLGVSSYGDDNGGQIKAWTTDLSFDTSYTFIIAYTALDEDGGTTTDGYSELWVDPVSDGSDSVLDNMPSATLLANPAYDDAWNLSLRQGNGLTGVPQVLFDAIAAGTTFDEVLTALGGAAPTGDADFDADGDIDGADFLIWQRNVGTGGGQSLGNADGLGGIDGDDLAIWEAQFGSAVAASQPVPEPATLVLAALGALACVGFVPRRNR
jgi:hypothetical protein